MPIGYAVLTTGNTVHATPILIEPIQVKSRPMLRNKSDKKRVLQRRTIYDISTKEIDRKRIKLVVI